METKWYKDLKLLPAGRRNEDLKKPHPWTVPITPTKHNKLSFQSFSAQKYLV